LKRYELMKAGGASSTAFGELVEQKIAAFRIESADTCSETMLSSTSILPYPK
jgi:hypothetical protein